MAYLDPDKNLNISQACRSVGVSRSGIYKHLQRWEAIEWLEKRREEICKAHSPKITSALIRKAEAGDVAAIRLFFEMFGDLKTRVEHTTNIPQIVIREYGQPS